MPDLHLIENVNHSIVETKLDRKRPLGYHSNSYSWKGKERTPPFGQTARVCTGKQTNLGFSEGILPRQLEFSFFDGEVNVNFEWSTLCALGWRTKALYIYSRRALPADGKNLHMQPRKTKNQNLCEPTIPAHQMRGSNGAGRAGKVLRAKTQNFPCR